MSLTPLIEQRGIVVCCGPGGVGKTTTSAAVALEGARRGRRAVVVTIDPARRLADALGLGSLSNIPSRVEGDWPGELWALMLDTKSTFDTLVLKYAPSRQQAARILENRFYRNISAALSGTQEYMAMEKLYELHAEGRFDLIVVDTPPTRNALDFLDAPRRLTRLLDNRVFRLLVTPARPYLRAVSVATQAFLRTVARVVGSEVVDDAVTFFQAFEGMEEGFRQRAQQVLELLSDEGTAFVLVASPRRDAVEEADFFGAKLAEGGIGVSAVVVNRMHPSFGPHPIGGDAGRARGDGHGAGAEAGAGAASAEAARRRAATLSGTPLGALFANLADFRQLAEGERAHVEALLASVAPAPGVLVPVLAGDVHDLDGLAAVGAYVFAG